MTLRSRHYSILSAARETLRADADLLAVIPSSDWRIQKKSWHRMQRWEPGAYLVPLRRSNPNHENLKARLLMPVLVAVVWPGDGELATEIESRLAVGERVEELFRQLPRRYMPMPLQNLDASFAGTPDAFSLIQITVEPGEPFMDGAFAAGLDVASAVVTFDVSVCKQNLSSLGA